MTFNKALWAVASAALLYVSPAIAEDGASTPLAAPTGEVLLTVGGVIGQTNADGTAQFDMDMLMAMEPVSFTTTTNWTEGAIEFTGVPLKGLLESVGAEGTQVWAVALNDYAVSIPIDSLEDGSPIVAYHMNGETFSRRDKGPLWIVFPYDSDPKYRSDVTFGQSIWQLAKLNVE